MSKSSTPDEKVPGTEPLMGSTSHGKDDEWTALPIHVQGIFDALADYVFLKDRQSKVIMANRSSALDAGYKAGRDLVGKSDFDLLPEDLAKSLFEEEQRIMQTGRPVLNREVTFRDANGMEKCHLITKTPVRDYSGMILGVLGVSRDITEFKKLQEQLGRANRALEERVKEQTRALEKVNEALTEEIDQRRKAERELQERHQILTALINNIPDFIYIKDRQSRVMLANLASAKAAGLDDPARMQGLSDFDILPESAAREFFEQEQRLMAQGQGIVNQNETFLDKDGVLREYLSSKLPMRDETGQVVGLIGIGREVTDLRRAEREALKQKNLIQTIFNAVPDLFYIKDTEGRVLFANEASIRAAQKLNIQNLIGTTDNDMFTEQKAREFREVEERIMRTGEAVYNVEEWTESINGVRSCILSTKLPYRDENGKIVGIIGVGRDITARKAAEANMARTERLAAVGTLAAGAAHQFNNLHAVIIGRLEYALMTEEMSPALREHLDLILRTALRATEITRGLVNFSKKSRASFKNEQLNNVIEDTIRLLQEEFQSEGVTIAFQKGDLPPFVMDVGGVSQVIINLLINARHALMGSGTKSITIRTGLEGGDKAFCSVEDTGCGIPLANLKQIFDPFFSTKGVNASPNDPQSVLEGTGLGLSVCHNIIRHHRGELTVESQVGKGSTFRFYLPVRGADITQHPISVDAVAVTSVSGAGETVLVVDDDDAVRDLFCSALRAQGFKPVGFRGADGVLDILKSGLDCRLVVCDLQMPVTSGFELLKMIKDLKLKNPPVLMVATGKFGDEDDQRLAELGIRFLMRKPFTIQEFVNEVKRALKSVPQPQPSN